MPPFRIIQAALRKTTERLAREVVEPSTSPPDWNDFEWAVASAAAAMQGVSVLLANTLTWSGPTHWQSFLTAQKKHSLLRHKKIENLLRQLDREISSAGTRVAALKGAAFHELDFYTPGERPMSDIDLLVLPADLSVVGQCLGRLDYDLAFISPRHSVFEPREKVPSFAGFGEHIEHPIKIEVHTVISEALPCTMVDITSRINVEKVEAGLKMYPTRSTMMLHLLLHAAGNIRRNMLRQIQLHDIAILARRLSDLEWRSLIAESDGKSNRWWMFPPLALTDRYYQGVVSSEVMCQTRALCPHGLRSSINRKSLTDVSWSNLRMQAFPGISWSRTPIELARFVRQRLFPGHSVLQQHSNARKFEPILNQSPWYNLSRGSRMLRWLFSKPPRVQTAVLLRAALESASFRNTH